MSQGDVPTAAADSSAPSSSRAVVIARAALIVFGTLLTLWGFWLAFTTNRPQNLLGLAAWLLGALVLHDGILSSLTWGANRLLRGAGKALPLSALAVVQGGVITAFMISLLAIPLLVAKAKGPQISTLPLNYGLNYLLTWLGISAFTLAVAIFLITRARRR